MDQSDEESNDLYVLVVDDTVGDPGIKIHSVYDDMQPDESQDLVESVQRHFLSSINKIVHEEHLDAPEPKSSPQANKIDGPRKRRHFPKHNPITKWDQRPTNGVKNRDRKRPCGTCSKMIISKYMTRHMKIHNDGTHPCPHCPAIFRTKKTVCKHIQKHFEVTPFLCDLCPETFTSSAELRSHIYEHTQQAFYCDYCKQAFKNKSTVKIHIMTMHTGGQYACTICGKLIHSQHALKRHIMRVHNQEKVKCSDCHKIYTTMTILKAHMEAKHGKTLMSRKPRKRVQKHKQEAFYCDYCKQVFKSKTTLKFHTKAMHTGGQYLCTECGKSIRSEYSLKRHITRVHNQKKVKCSDCHKIYSSMTALNDHMKAKHGKTVMSRKMFFNKLPTMIYESMKLEDAIEYPLEARVSVEPVEPN